MTPKALVFWALVGCGATAVETQLGPSEPGPVAEAETTGPAVDPPVPMPGAGPEEEEGNLALLIEEAQAQLPAVHADGRFAFIEETSDCCSDRFRQVGVILPGPAREDFVMVDVDPHGEPVDGVDGLEALRAFQRALDGFTVMSQHCDGEPCAMTLSGTELDITLTEAGELRAGRRVVWTLPTYSLDPGCCDGGLGEVVTCAVRGNTWALWAEGAFILGRAGYESQADGCGVSPRFYAVAPSPAN